MLLKFLLALLAVGIVVSVYAKYTNDWSPIPRLLRFVLLPVYLYAFIYVYFVFYAFGQFISDLVSWLLGITIGLIASLFGLDWAHSIWEIIGDITFASSLIYLFVFLVNIPNFGRERGFTYLYRLVILAAVTLVMLYVIIFTPMDGQSWYDTVVYATAMLVAAYLSHSLMLKDKREGTE